MSLNEAACICQLHLSCSLFSPCSYKLCFSMQSNFVQMSLAPDQFGWDKSSLWFAVSGEKQSRRGGNECGIAVEPKMRQMLSQSAKASHIWTIDLSPKWFMEWFRGEIAAHLINWQSFTDCLNWQISLWWWKHLLSGDKIKLNSPNFKSN